MIYDFDELYFQILTVININHREGVFDVNGRPYAALSYRISGSGRFEIDGKSFVSNPGDLLFVPAGSSYKVEYTGGNMIVVHFSDCNYHLPENISLENAEYVKIKFEDMLKSWDKQHSPNAIKALIFKTLQSVYDSKSQIGEDTLSRIVDFMSANFASPGFDISDVCREFYVSGSTLRRRFSEGTGIPPKQYLIKLRLDKAIDMLATGEYTVKTVSQSCGFCDEKYFSRIFKERYGKSPSDINKKLMI